MSCGRFDQRDSHVSRQIQVGLLAAAVHSVTDGMTDALRKVRRRCRIQSLINIGGDMEREIAKWVRAAFIPAIGLSLALPVFAAGDNASSPDQTAASAQPSKQQSAKDQKQSLREMRASQLIGRNVTNPQGQSLGEISDLIVNMNNGDVRYAILQFDKGMFSGERLFAVPTSELKFSQGNDKVVYNMRREQLEKAGIERNQWPSAAGNNEYLSGLDRTYGIVQPSNDRRAYSASELLGKDVNGTNGNDVGEIRDLVIDMNGQRVHYAVLAFDPSWTAPEKLYAFPVSAFTFTDGKDELALNVDKSKLQSMRSFDHSLWSAYSTPVFVTDIDRYLVTITPLSGSSASGSGQSSGSMASSARDQGSGASSSSAGQGSTGSSSGSNTGNQTSSAGQRNSSSAGQTNSSSMSQSGQRSTASSDNAGQNTSASASGKSGQVGVIDAPPPQYTAAMKRLQDSAQRLRESIQAMAQHPPGANRDKAIKDAQQALYDTNEAMIQLPPDMRTVSGDKTQGTGTTASAGGSGSARSSNVSEAEYKKSTQELQQSSQQLHSAIQAISQQPQGQRRDQAIQEAKQALNEVGQAMTQLGATTQASK
jgi:sporulation protein YlmC with PRC-barrel domain